MPCKWDGCRAKDIHCVGVVSKVKFVTVDNPFSGIFQGADYGFVRHSTAAPYSKDKKALTPGLGLKFLRDGKDSANLVSMFSVDGQADWNFFANEWSNHIPKPQSKALTPLALKFYTETYYVQAVGLSDMAQYDQSGKEETLKFPFSLRFEPMPELQWSSDYTEDPMEQLSGIKEGTTVWKIYGLDAPTELGGQEHLIGSLVTDSETTKSKYGDDMMLFRHQRAEDDIKLKPEWTDYYPKYYPLQGEENFEEGDCRLFDGGEMKSTCPFAFLLQ